MSTHLKRPLIIYDAIHQVMEYPPHFAELLHDLINLPAVQRLRRIKQQSLSDLVFPTATHTRFSHALGTAFIASRMIRQIKRQGLLPDFDELSEKILLTAALLHDIGHGPLSHTFEVFLKRLGVDLKHEDWTESILTSEPFARIFQKHGLCGKEQLIIDLITKKGSKRKEALKKEHPHWFLAGDIISSQLDGDRLDYLLRDSHFCGVAYGNFDLNWLISCLTAVDYEGVPRLGITSQGIGSVEHFLLARRLMYQNIYCYAKIVAFERLIVEFLMELSRLYPTHATTLESLLGHFLSLFFKEMAEAAGKREFRQKAFSSYLMLSDDDVWNAVRDIYHFLPKIPSFTKVLELAERLYLHKTPKVYRIHDDKLATLRLPKFRQDLGIEDDSQWKCDTVQVSFSLYSTLEDPILVQQTESPFGTIKTLSLHSELVKQLSDRIEPSHWLMIDKGIMEKDDRRIKPFVEDLIRA
ncbi:HD domain-containing protein [Estrella lausannensis]|uniref:Metal dependent phosphohydrolase n=1 Tax=Estrella lausannensis TaxID=483423 RepID=A0A0H5E5U8_9BACT|nr:HD domain-containing protein [Estrella lausannensis]CRX38595.1 Metal dependent phosphohydrolase [Estrella lausannensis]